jgi:hypothetical protein
MSHWVFSSLRRKRALVALVLVICGTGAVWLLLQHRVSNLVQVTQPGPGEPLSYQVMQVAQTQVKALKPPPTEAALYYAYVASAYADALQKADEPSAVQASRQVMNAIYPSRAGDVNAGLDTLGKSYGLDLQDVRQDVIAEVVTTYSGRYKSDGHDLPWNGIIPTGTGKWRKERPADPFTPRAGDWKRWVVNKPIAVPPPPVPGSAEDMRQMEIVRQASANRNGQDVNIINFWGGVPGTEAPAGIWQNQLYRTVKSELTPDALEADRQYAAVQKALAQTLSDAFMECWKVKYTYWTARPDMRDPILKTAMDNPNFPGYVSGHSTISKAAADVLSVMVPGHAQEWQAMAAEARDSRLKAGIHYDIDNQIGFQIGTEVADQVVKTLGLKKGI